MAMESRTRTGRIVGVLFVLTFITSIPALLLYGPLLNHSDYILGAGADSRIEWGAFLEVLLAITGIGTAVVLFPVLKRQSEGLALGYVACRILESSMIVVGLVSVLSVVTLRQDLAGASGADAASIVTTGRSLVAVKDWTFLLGPGFCAGIGNGALLGYLLYRSRLVPRRMALIGLVGGPLAFLAATLALLGVYDQNSAAQNLLTIPEIVWEASLGLYLTVAGFRAVPVVDEVVDSALLPKQHAATEVADAPAVR